MSFQGRLTFLFMVMFMPIAACLFFPVALWNLFAPANWQGSYKFILKYNEV